MFKIPDPITGYPVNIYYACGDAICKTCGLDYYHHPKDKQITSFDNKPYLRILCNGDRVKL